VDTFLVENSYADYRKHHPQQHQPADSKRADANRDGESKTTSPPFRAAEFFVSGAPQGAEASTRSAWQQSKMHWVAA